MLDTSFSYTKDPEFYLKWRFENSHFPPTLLFAGVGIQPDGSIETRNKTHDVLRSCLAKNLIFSLSTTLSVYPDPMVINRAQCDMRIPLTNDSMASIFRKDFQRHINEREKFFNEIIIKPCSKCNNDELFLLQEFEKTGIYSPFNGFADIEFIHENWLLSIPQTNEFKEESYPGNLLTILRQIGKKYDYSYVHENILRPTRNDSVQENLTIKAKKIVSTLLQFTGKDLRMKYQILVMN